MQYRLEYSYSAAECAGEKKYIFEAETNEEAASKVPEICKQLQEATNKCISNPFWHYEIVSPHLYKIIQPEISEEIKI